MMWHVGCSVALFAWFGTWLMSCGMGLAALLAGWLAEWLAGIHLLLFSRQYWCVVWYVMWCMASGENMCIHNFVFMVFFIILVYHNDTIIHINDTIIHIKCTIIQLFDLNEIGFGVVLIF